jgi:hypothetical protein
MAHTPYSYKHIIVVHGIGDQAPNETALGFMNEFVRALPHEDDKLKPILHNLIESVDDLTKAASDNKLGAGHAPRSFQPAYVVFADRRDMNNRKVCVIGFSEVYWQPISRHYFKENGDNLPIPLFTWARTIPTRLLGPGYKLAQWRAAIENLITILKLLEKLAAISKNIKLFVNVTKSFLGDVQMYAESDKIRQEINAEFFRVAGRIKALADDTEESLLSRVKRKDPYVGDFDEFERFGEREIYVVAHSEGTVVAYNSLVQAAMIGEGPNRHGSDPEYQRAYDADNKVGSDVKHHVSDWFPDVKGLVTLGSPLDKHFVIWETRFRKHFLKEQPETQIPWFNFTDRSDPVAYELDELKTEQGKPAETDATKLFQIKEHTFQRYPIPGKAHVDYWTDRAIHEHIIYNMMKLAAGTPSPLNDRWWARLGLQEIGDSVGYVVGRVVTFWFGLFFLNRLLSTSALDLVRELPLLANLYHMISTQPFGSEAAIFNYANYATWLLAPFLVMKLLVEAEQGLFFGVEWPPAIRRVVLTVPWLAVAFIICLFMNAGAGGAEITDMVGYGTGLVVTVLIWKLHTAVHKGLIQLWRYTKVL